MPLDDSGSAADLVIGALRHRIGHADRKPFVLGLCGAQGSGKSTLADRLCDRLVGRGLRVAILSIDDLYLTLDRRRQLAATVHPLCRTRGVPGTHDVAMGLALFDALAGDGIIELPRFDKAADDRAPRERWPRVQAPVDVVLFEGWCVGARPQEDRALDHPVNALERDEDEAGRWRRWSNAQLAGSYQRLFDRIDMLVLLAAPDFSVVAGWRTEQEEALRAERMARGGDRTGLLNATAIRRFIQYYERITNHILAEMPERADLVIRLDRRRRPSC